MTEITKGMYRDALHYYLKYAYPDDDESYYSKWAWMVGGSTPFFEQGDWEGHYPKTPKDFPREVRFGCYCSGNTKLRCYEEGFLFDTNHAGDPPEIVKKVKAIKAQVEAVWVSVGIPVFGYDYGEAEPEEDEYEDDDE